MSGLIANPDAMTQAIMQAAGSHPGQAFNSAAAAQMRQVGGQGNILNSAPTSTGLLSDPSQAIKQANPLNSKIAPYPTTRPPVVTTPPNATTSPPTTTTPPTVDSTMNPDTATNMFPYYGYYYGNDSIDHDPTNDPRAQAFLSAYQKYDPNAHFTSNGVYGGEGGGGSESWSFVGDHTKLPGGGPTGMDRNSADYNPMYTTGNDILSGNASGDNKYGGATANDRGASSVLQPGHQYHLADADRGGLYNPNFIYGNNQYGYETPTDNVKVPADWMDIVGPLLVGGFGAVAGGGGALASLLEKSPGLINSFANGQFDPMQLASLGIPFIPGVSPTMASLSRLALSTVNSTRRGG